MDLNSTSRTHSRENFGFPVLAAAVTLEESLVQTQDSHDSSEAKSLVRNSLSLILNDAAKPSRFSLLGLGPCIRLLRSKKKVITAKCIRVRGSSLSAARLTPGEHFRHLPMIEAAPMRVED